MLVAFVLVLVGCSSTESTSQPTNRTLITRTTHSPSTITATPFELDCPEGYADVSFDPFIATSFEGLELAALSANHDLDDSHERVETLNGSLTLIWRRNDGTVWALLKAKPVGTETYELVSLTYCD